MVVPLSEREKRILEEIERNLEVEDPRFGPRSGSTAHGKHRSNTRLGALLFVVGLAVLVGFFLSGIVLVGVIAFGAMVTGIIVAAAAVDGMASSGRARKERMADAFSHWERRLRDKYRRR